MNKEYFPQFIYWELSNYCNLQCKHCFAEATNKKDTIVNDTIIKNKLDELKRKGDFSIRFGGGEPLMVPYICDLIEFCNAININASITTNGLLLSTDMACKLGEAGLSELTISIDGNKETHDFIRGKGNFERIVDIIDRIGRTLAYKLSIAITVTCQNYNEIERVIELFYNKGIRKFFFFRYCYNHNKRMFEMNSEQLFFATRIITKCEKIYQDSKFVYEPSSFYQFLLKRDNARKGLCNFINDTLTIKYDGKIVVCAALQKELGNIWKDDLDEIFQKIIIEKKQMQEIPNECRGCVWSIKCRGGCKSYSYNIDTTYNKKDGLCFYSRLDLLPQKRKRVFLS